MTLAALALFCAAPAGQAIGTAQPAMVEDAGDEVAQIFFEWDSYAPGPAATELLNAVIASLNARPWRRLWIEGHTDRTSTRDYALGLSERMARSVQDYLASHGVDPARIATIGCGWEGPNVPTAEGVREPLNRRVTIRVQWE